MRRSVHMLTIGTSVIITKDRTTVKWECFTEFRIHKKFNFKFIVTFLNSEKHILKKLFAKFNFPLSFPVFPNNSITLNAFKFLHCSDIFFKTNFLMLKDTPDKQRYR